MKSDILQEQVQYYRDRASEYDQWVFRQGRYDRGENHRQQWFLEVSQVENALRATIPAGDILELACGTGLWTQHLATLATRLTAVDASPEVIALNQQRVVSASVEYIVLLLTYLTGLRIDNLILSSLDFGFLMCLEKNLYLSGRWLRKR
ncbi:MAG: methyltransferase domain-containing protein [Waterburya sp.]